MVLNTLSKKTVNCFQLFCESKINIKLFFPKDKSPQNPECLKNWKVHLKCNIPLVFASRINSDEGVCLNSIYESLVWWIIRFLSSHVMVEDKAASRAEHWLLEDDLCLTMNPFHSSLPFSHASLFPKPPPQLCLVCD